MNTEVITRMEVAEDEYLARCARLGVTPDSEERCYAMLQGALADRLGLRRAVERIAYGWDDYDGDGAVDFWDDTIDTTKFTDRLAHFLTNGRPTP